MFFIIKDSKKILVELYSGGNYNLPSIKNSNSYHSISDIESKIKEKYSLEVIGVKEAFSYDGNIGYEAHVPHKTMNSISSQKWVTIKMALKHGISNVDNLKLEEYFKSLDSIGIQLQYGLRDGKILHISELTEKDKGLACFCKCPACKGNLEARLGSKRRHHFAHHKEACDIAIAQETALHLLAKEILVENRHIMLPAYVLDGSDGGFIDDTFSNYDAINQQLRSYEYSKPIDYEFDHAILEERMGNFTPDIVIWRDSHGRKLIVEIAVTHFVDDVKRSKIIEQGVSAIEIDISQYHNSQFDRNLLKEIIVDGHESKEWIYNLNYEKALAKLEKRNAAIVAQAKKEEAERQILIDKIVKKRREEALIKEKRDQHRIEHITNAIKEENYRVIASNLRNDELANKHFRRAKLYNSLGPEIPFYLDMPVTGQIAFTCDRRIWQMKIFEKLLFYEEKDWDISLYNIWKDFAEKGDRKLVNWEFAVKQTLQIGNKNYTDNLAIDAIKQYLSYLGKLDFIEYGGYTNFKKRHAIVSKSIGDTPISERLRIVLDSIEDDVPEIDSNVEDVYNDFFPSSNPHVRIRFHN